MGTWGLSTERKDKTFGCVSCDSCNKAIFNQGDRMEMGGGLLGRGVGEGRVKPEQCA